MARETVAWSSLAYCPSWPACKGPAAGKVRFGCQELNAPVGETKVGAAGVTTAEGADPHVDLRGLKLGVGVCRRVLPARLA